MRRIIVAAITALGLVQGVTAQDAVGQWESTVNEACAEAGCDPALMLSIIRCESGGDENAGPHPNPYGGSDWGLLQINDATWGDIAYAGGVEQIWFAASLLASPGGSYNWTCAGGVQ